MKRIGIDFAPRSLRRTLFRAPAAAWGPALAGAALCAVALAQVLDYREAREEVAAQQAALRSRVAVPAARPATPAAPIAAPQASAVNAAVMQLNLPWRALHDAVRRATPPTVALLALDPDAKKRVLRITAEARGSDDMLAYVAALGREPGFTAVALTRHEVVEQDPNRPLRFQVDAGWGAP